MRRVNRTRTRRPPPAAEGASTPTGTRVSAGAGPTGVQRADSSGTENRSWPLRVSPRTRGSGHRATDSGESRWLPSPPASMSRPFRLRHKNPKAVTSGRTQRTDDHRQPTRARAAAAGRDAHRPRQQPVPGSISTTSDRLSIVVRSAAIHRPSGDHRGEKKWTPG